MSHYKYDRLSAQDNDFLLWEHENLSMHGGSIQVFDVGSLATEDGGVDFDIIVRGIEGILHKIPRYRERIAWVPGETHAIWVDDANFSLEYHIRHTALPRPGSDAQLKQLAARIAERPLDRSRPLWEIWVVEGLEGDRFATIGKTHHCMIDGAGGVDLAKSLFSNTPDYTIPKPPRFIPRPQPSDSELRRDGLVRIAGLPFRMVEELQKFVRNTEDPAGEIIERARALGALAKWKINSASDTPLNGPVGPHRVLDWFEVPLADIKAIRRALDCSVNDVVLGIMTGAVRDYMIDRQVDPAGLDFRVAAPVNVRSKSQEGEGGNHVSTWIVPLPLGEEDPLEQIAAIHAHTSELKESHQAAAIQMVEALHEWIPIDLQSLSKGTQNLYVTNVPGPSFPLYFLGAELKSIYLQVPLIENLGMAVGVLSYNGKVCWSFTADPDRVPDIGDFTAIVRRSFERVAEMAGVEVGVADEPVRAEMEVKAEAEVEAEVEAEAKADVKPASST